MRIVSLLPSATEMVCALGLEDQLVGVTHECDYPPSVSELPKVTHTLIPHDSTSAQIDALVRERMRTQRALYTLDLSVLEQLQPNLIVTQALCDVCAVAAEEVRAAACQLRGQPQVVNLEPMTLTDVLDSIRQLGAMTETVRRAEHVTADLRARVAAVTMRTAHLRYRPRVTVLEWIDPPFSCGHWSPELVRLAGGVEGLGKEGRPSRTLQWEEVVAWQPEVLLIACCGCSVERTLRDLPLLRSYPGWEDLPCTRTDRVYVLDGSAYLSRPGPRLVDSLEILAHALHPELHPAPPNSPAALMIKNSELTCQRLPNN